MMRAAHLPLALLLALPAAACAVDDAADAPDTTPQASMNDVVHALARAETYPREDLEGFGVVVDQAHALVDQALPEQSDLEARLAAVDQRLQSARAAIPKLAPAGRAVRFPFPGADSPDGDSDVAYLSTPLFGIPCLGKDEANDRFGTALAQGDFDGDGYDDLAVGTPSETTRFAYDTGRVYVYHGGLGGYSPWFSLGQDSIGADEGGDHFGSSLAAADFDGDGLVDLAVGAPEEDVGGIHDSGYVYVFRGGATGLTPWAGLGQDLGATETNDRFGFAVVAGDFNGDGLADLAVDTLNEDTLGAVATGFIYVFRGTSTGLTAWRGLHHDSLAPAEDGEGFGEAMAVGDFNGDGRDDLAAGSPFGNHGAGAAWVFKARPLLSNVGTLSTTMFSFRQLPYELQASQMLDQGGLGSNERYDRFGASMASGDFDGDGDDDLVVGSPGDSAGAYTGAGLAFGFRSSGSLLGPWLVLGADAMQAPLAYSRFGSSIVAGDLNGDGIDDVAIGRPMGSKRLFLWRGNRTSPLPWGTLEPLRYSDGSAVDFTAAMAIGDVNGDGLADLTASTPGERVGTVSGAGAASLFVGRSGTYLPVERDAVSQQAYACIPTWPSPPSINLVSSSADQLVVQFSAASNVSQLVTYASGNIGPTQITPGYQVTRTFTGLSGSTRYCFHAHVFTATSNDPSDATTACFTTAEPEPIEHTIPVQLVAQAGYYDGNNAYDNTWGPVYGARMVRFSIPVSYPDHYILKFLKPGYYWQDCNNSAAVVALGDGATATPAQLATLFGANEPSGKVEFRACRIGPTVVDVRINVVYVYDDGH